MLYFRKWVFLHLLSYGSQIQKDLYHLQNKLFYTQGVIEVFFRLPSAKRHVIIANSESKVVQQVFGPLNVKMMNLGYNIEIKPKVPLTTSEKRREGEEMENNPKPAIVKDEPFEFFDIEKK